METVGKYRRLLAASGAIGLLLAFWLLNERADAPWRPLLPILLILASTTLAFLFISILFSKENRELQKQIIEHALEKSGKAGQSGDIHQELKFIPNNIETINNIISSTGTGCVLSQVRWDELIRGSSEIDFVVQGWDRWSEQTNIERALRGFFERGGQFRLYTYHESSRGGAEARSLMERRLNRPPRDVALEIAGTYRAIADIRDQLPQEIRNKSKLEIVKTNNLNWYFAALFKGSEVHGQTKMRDVLVFSIYSHTKMRPWDMPAALIYPDLHREVNMYDWFNAELRHLREASVPQ